MKQGDLLWQPSEARKTASRLADYQRWLAAQGAPPGPSYNELWQWSVEELDDFWLSIWNYFDIQADGVSKPVLGRREMPGAQWFPKARLNYAEHVFRHVTDNSPALIARSEDGPVLTVSWSQLQRDVGALAAKLRGLGLGPGDRVASYMPNRPETVIAFLACASIGAIWSSCSPDMGAGVVIDRFRQIEPRLLFTVDGVHYNGKVHDRLQVVEKLLTALPSVTHVIHVGGRPGCSPEHWPGYMRWQDAVADPAPLVFDRLAFDHPLWIVYSSGTTGTPKAIVHGHGGIVLTHLKTMALQHDLRAHDRLLFLGGTGWIVWNLQVGGLLLGATVVLYDGHPAWPTRESLWQFIDEHRITLLGCGAAYLIQCMNDQLRPAEHVELKHLRAINSTGSPLPVTAYEWVYSHVKQDLWLASISGGTDIASGFVACAPTLPVRAGEIQCRELGVAAYAFNESGQAVVDQVGELVITKPMPSMPVKFWNDHDQRRYTESYFEVFPGYWRHGDWIRFTPEGSSVIYGRSDSTINRHGIRMGTAEIYRVVEALPEVSDSLVVDLEYLDRPSLMPLFVVLEPGRMLDDDLVYQIKDSVRTQASPRHVPDQVYQISQVPRTLTGKKMEVPVRRLLLGMPAHQVAQPDAMVNPDSLEFFIQLAREISPRS